MIGSGLAQFERSEFSQTPISPSTARKPERPTQQDRKICTDCPADHPNRADANELFVGFYGIKPVQNSQRLARRQWPPTCMPS